MLNETGIVIKAKGDTVWVNTQSKLACSSCKVESTCGNGILEKYLAGKVFVSQIKNTLSAKVGDQVTLAIPKASVTKASLVVYCIPLSGLIIGALLANFLDYSEPWIIALSFLGLFLGLYIGQIYNRRIEQNERFVVKMVSKAATGFAPSEFASIRIKNIE